MTKNMFQFIIQWVWISHPLSNKANLRYLIAATGLVIILKLDSNNWFFTPCDLEIWWMTWKNYRAPLQALFIISNLSVNSNWSYCLETLNSGQNQWFIVPCDLEIWWMTLKNNRASLLCYIKLCASCHPLIQTGVTVQKRSIPVKIGDFLFCATLKFD